MHIGIYEKIYIVTIIYTQVLYIYIWTHTIFYIHKILYIHIIYNIYIHIYIYMGFPGGSVRKESICSAGDLGSIPGLGRSPGEGHGNPLQYSCLDNPHEPRSLVGCSPGGRKGLDMTKQLSTMHNTYIICVCVLCLVPQACPTLCDPMNCSLPGSSVHGIFQ